jgi:hypothetical protein
MAERILKDAIPRTRYLRRMEEIGTKGLPDRSKDPIIFF